MTLRVGRRSDVRFGSQLKSERTIDLVRLVPLADIAIT